MFLEQDFKLATQLVSTESIQNGDMNVLKDAVISLTQAVTTLSTHNYKLSRYPSSFILHVFFCSQDPTSISKHNVQRLRPLTSDQTLHSSRTGDAGKKSI